MTPNEDSSEDVLDFGLDDDNDLDLNTYSKTEDVEELEERVRELEDKVRSKIGWGELIIALIVLGIIVGLFR